VVQLAEGQLQIKLDRFEETQWVEELRGPTQHVAAGNKAVLEGIHNALW
jgi:hypothetical protein